MAIYVNDRKTSIVGLWKKKKEKEMEKKRRERRKGEGARGVTAAGGPCFGRIVISSAPLSPTDYVSYLSFSFFFNSPIYTKYTPFYRVWSRFSKFLKDVQGLTWPCPKWTNLFSFTVRFPYLNHMN